MKHIITTLDVLKRNQIILAQASSVKRGTKTLIMEVNLLKGGPIEFHLFWKYTGENEDLHSMIFKKIKDAVKAYNELE